VASSNSLIVDSASHAPDRGKLLADDPDRLARFQREAQVLGALNGRTAMLARHASRRCP